LCELPESLTSEAAVTVTPACAELIVLVGKSGVPVVLVARSIDLDDEDIALRVVVTSMVVAVVVKMSPMDVCVIVELIVETLGMDEVEVEMVDDEEVVVELDEGIGLEVED